MPPMTISTAPLAPCRTIGRTDLVVSPLCLGGNVFGWTADRDQSFAVLDAYTAAGGNFIDTSDVYSEWVAGNTGGDSERIIGEWLAARGLAPDTIRRALDDSLRRLQTDYIDLYYAHEDDADVPMAEVLGTLGELISSGKVRHIAASNFSPERLQQALDISAAEGLPSYVAIQDQYNLMERAFYEKDLEPIVVAHGLSSLPYYSLARGFLTGKYRPGVTIDSPRAKGAEPYIGERGDRVLTALEAVAAARDCSMAAVALAWLIAQPGIAAPLASARTTEQLVDLVEMGSVDLSVDEIDALTSASN